MDQGIIIIGGGASGLMLASLLPPDSAIVIDSNNKLGAKMLVSGGGKCNITNADMGTEYFLGDSTFIASALKQFDQDRLLSWLAKRGLQPVLRKDNQYFCEKSAKEIVGLLGNEAEKQKILLNEKVIGVKKEGAYFNVRTDKQRFKAKRVVVASGGLSYPLLGAGPIGYEIAENFAHTTVKTAPALVGFTVQKEQFFFKELSGTSTDVEILVGDKVCKGSLLFAHKGISGPAVLDASLYWEKGKIEVDFLPGFSWKMLQNSKKQISSLFPMPKRVTKAFLVQFNVNDKAGNKVTEEELTQLKTLNSYIFAPAGTFGYSKAEVTRGGVNTDEVDAQTMMSKKVEGLYFTGEVLDVTGRLGGYNFQWAFSSAFLCAKNLNGDKNEN